MSTSKTTTAQKRRPSSSKKTHRKTASKSTILKSKIIHTSSKQSATVKKVNKTVKASFLKTKTFSLQLKLRIAAASIFICTGLVILFLPPLYLPWNQAETSAMPAASAVVQKQPAESSALSGQPTTLDIPSLGLHVPVINGSYNPATKEWTLTLDKAQFATPSTLPNTVSGNTLIYGHYRPEVFASLHLIEPGATASVVTYNKLRFNYRFSRTFSTKPTDTSIFSYKGPPQLTLQTCSGAYFQNRQMYLFTLQAVEQL